MVDLIVTIALAAVGILAVAAVIYVVVSRLRARTGTRDPASMTEILRAERQAHVSHGPRGAQDL